MPNFLLRRLLPNFKKFSFFSEKKGTHTPVSFDIWYNQKVLGHCRNAHWPVHSKSTVISYNNIKVGFESCPGLSPGCYIQGIGGIKIGDYTIIAPNVGIISANHAIYDKRIHKKKKVVIGDYCWIGFSAVILPGVILGDFTIVGAGAVVTKSFTDGYCIIGGNPAKVIKRIDKDKCLRYESEKKYIGYIPFDLIDCK